MSDLIDIKKRNPVERLTIANTLIQSVIADFPTQSNAPNTVKTSDCVSRQIAIDLIKSWSGGYDYIEIPTDAAVKSFDRLPSAQPEITRCKDCIFYDGRPCGIVDWWNTADDFCSKAERRTDE